MITQSFDTYLSAEKTQISLIRKSSIAKRISRVRSLSQTTMQLSRRAISRANPELSEREVNLIFVAYHQKAFERRRMDTLDEESSHEFYLASSEDIILNKLEWYRMGGGVSEVYGR